MSALAQEALSESTETYDRRIPSELVDLTLVNLRYDPETLRCAARVSTEWLPIARAYLFAHISLPEPELGTTRTACSALYAVLSKSPHIARYIRHVTIITGPYDWIEFPTSPHWIFTDETLPLLLDILLTWSRVQSFHINLSHQPWGELPVPLHTAIQSLISLPTMLAVDFTAVAAVDWAIFKHCRALKRLKFAAIRNSADPPADIWPATYESLTMLQTAQFELPKIISWVIAAPSFRALRDLRLSFDPQEDLPHVQALLRHISATLESLHLQPYYADWPAAAPLTDISILRVLSSLRLSLRLSADCNPLPWAAALINTSGPTSIQRIILDLRVGSSDPAVVVLPWAALDAELVSAPGTSSIVLTCFASKQRSTVDWLKGELPGLLPRAHARKAFQSREIDFSPTDFFYWPGPLSWGSSLGVEEQD
ncbi:hypothetical protein FB451DRAFT_1553903 [Mycena latifolia]|nr:hypothetical protein FB451DRAFT_1553903 [Mycena latifolia]